jgi:hypothetical protein
MLKSLALSNNKILETTYNVSNNCKNRIKPTMLSVVKTEALLVFARTALERFFQHINENKLHPKVGTKEETEYVYNTLRDLNTKLQEVVVNADYLINLVQSAKKYPELRSIAKIEEPLMNYYDAMAQQVAIYFDKRPAYIPEFLVICMLNHWIFEEEKDISLYPFLKDVDFEKLIYIFEMNRKEFIKDDLCIISDIFEISSVTIEKLKSTKYKVNKDRVSKTRKKR